MFKKLCSNPRHKDMPYTGFIEYTNVLIIRRAHFDILSINNDGVTVRKVKKGS